MVKTRGPRKVDPCHAGPIEDRTRAAELGLAAMALAADAELDSQFFVDLVFTPGRIVSAHPSDERDESWAGRLSGFSTSIANRA